ncbi:ketopantoate reductase family protein [Gemella sp. GH3]|uniref:ketopantoate reductase family protein n=1 Tax=unclassified Gemella TaxID=2624949 RepID=UPI0015D006F0|nr:MULTISPECIES: ketopantoate reductase family protein [unclassified Gemella]MBF0714097.1 ketopantoate reductase family protein [Gemella sp. GH3.1]NYS51049.1 ketopantoate reductase family protein [Gemella sp. GH3]
MKILFAGAGALGSRFAYMLHKNGEDVTLIDSWQDHVEKIKKEGLKVIIDGEDLGNFNIPIFYPHELTGKYDVVFVATKSMQLRPMLETLKPYLKETTKVICILNGLGHVDTLKEYINPENILIGVTVWTSGLGGPGVLNAVGTGKTEIKQVSEADISTAKDIVAKFNEAGLNLIYSDNVYQSIWHKAGLNCVLNAYCTIIDCNIGEYGSYSEHQKLTDMLLEEVVSVGIAEGVDVKHDVISGNINRIFPPTLAGLHYPSLYQDMKNGRLTEIDYLNGAVSRLGKKHNIKTPVCDLVTHIIHAKEEINNNK